MSNHRVLVTNDDGIAAPGIRSLARAAADHGFDVVVAAPSEESSGISAAMTAVVNEGRVVIDRRELATLEGVPTFAVSASPGYIVMLGTLGAFGDRPDFVISGINRGANAGNAVLHSGTVGACLTAASAGLRAMAVSLDVLTPSTASAASGGAALANLDKVDDEARNWATAAELARKLMPALTTVPAGTVININVPDRTPGGVRGLRRAELAKFGQVQMTIAEAAEGYVRMSMKEEEAQPDPGTDLAFLLDGWATVTAIHTIMADGSVDLPLEDEPVTA
ncbi:MAG TPA: 5'/3'-nucleotidase SurE [Jiangellaceae bacterium]|jgi:5'-nucleotidase|nr:5'/3'-nucleotidase SurE [Jiangellaceae bacterium]